MKRTGIILGVFLLVTSSLHAQTEQEYLDYLSLKDSTERKVEHRSFWTVSVLGGAMVYRGEKDRLYKKNLTNWISAFGKASCSYWFSPVWGLRMQAGGGSQKNYAVEEEDPSTHGRFTYLDAHIGVITNVLNWGYRKRSHRPVSLCAFAGVGGAYALERKMMPAQLTPTLVLGGQFNVRLTDFWSIGLEVDGTVVGDNFNGHTGGRPYEGFARMSLGLVYRFR